MSRILFVGPIMPPIHGQSMAFTRLYESVNKKNKILVNSNVEGRRLLRKVISTSRLLTKIFYFVLFNKFDTVYFTCSRSALGSIKDILLVNLCSLKKVKIINHLHGSDFYDFLHSAPKWHSFILHATYKKVNESIVLMDSMKNQFSDYPDMKVHVVPNFYDDYLEGEAVESKGNVVKLLYLSNIIKSKGIIELIDAFKILLERHDNIRLNIAGDFMSDDLTSASNMRKTFYNKIGNHPKIQYMGKVFGQSKKTLLQQSDIFVLPSYYKSEALPISILEAMICKNVIITTNYKYLGDVIKKGNGITVNPRSSDSLILGLEKILNNKDLMRSIQINNFNDAKRKYSVGKYIESLHRILQL